MNPALPGDDVLLDRCYRGMEPFVRMFGGGPGSKVIDRDGVVACVVPASPNRSLLNTIWFDRERPERLIAEIESIRDEFEAAGVNAWSVWIQDGDEAAETVVQEYGLTLDSKPLAMGAAFDELDLSADTSLVSAHWDMAEVARINELGYELPAGVFRAIKEMPRPDGAHCFIAEQDGRAVSTVITFDDGDDLGIYWVATEPEHWRKGLGGATMTAALTAARERGMQTTTLQASDAGVPVYARLGYRDLGVRINLWELRRAREATD